MVLQISQPSVPFSVTHSKIKEGNIMWEFISIVILAGVIYYITTRTRNRDSQKKSAPDSTPPNQKGWRDKVRERLNIDEKKDNSGIKMIAYFVLLVIAFSVFHFTDGSNSFWYTFWVVVIGLHIIWFLSFFLIPGEGVGGITKFVIFGTFVFFFLAGIFPHKSDEWLGNIKAWRTEVDNKKSGETVHEIAPVEAKVEVIPLTTEWVSFIPLIPGKDTLFECLGSGGKMKITFTSGKETAIKSGEVIHCPLTGEKFWAGNGLVGAVYSFRDDTGKINELHIYNAKKL